MPESPRLPCGYVPARLAVLALCAFATVRAQGISWPPDQVLPHFTAAPELDVIDISGMPFDRKVAFTTLQGLVNRSRSRVYVLDAQQSHEGKSFWLDRITTAKKSVPDPFTLFTKYRAEIAGLCIYDPAVMGTVNAAVTAAGVRGCAVVSPDLSARLSAPPYALPVLLDLRTNRFADDRAAFRWAKDSFWGGCTHRMLAGMKPGAHYPLMDYIVANKALCVWLDPADSLDLPILKAAMQDMSVNGVYMGWWAGETRGVAFASGFGVMTFATDWFSNATVHGAGPRAILNPPTVAAPPPLRNKCYIALILSDGDNLQEQEHLFPIRWRSPERGAFPVSWTQSPALADFAPDMLNYFYATRTPKDGFITGPSGVGYVLPEHSRPADFARFVRLTSDYLARTGIRTATIWGNASWSSDAFGLDCPGLLGMANKQGGAAPMGARKWTGGLVSLEMAPDYASFGSQIIDEVTARMRVWNRSEPLFIAPQLNANAAGLEEMRKVVDAFADDTGVVFVRADQLFQLMRGGGLGTGIAPAPSGPFARGRFIPVDPGHFSRSGSSAVDARGRSVPVLFAETPPP